LIESGRKLALEGAPEAGIPPCAACHGNPAGGAPRLAGQHAAYMAGQLRLLRMGHVPATAGAPLMAPVAQRLSDDQIDAVSAFFATLPPEPREARLP
jgi:cytochrome c553